MKTTILFWCNSFLTYVGMFDIQRMKIVMKKTADSYVFSILSVVLLLILSGCGGILYENWAQNGPRLDPYQGAPKVFWKEHGVPNPNSYTFLGTVSARSGCCLGMADEKLHQYLINEAPKHGGDGVILNCGPLGSDAEEWCYGNVIRFKR